MSDNRLAVQSSRDLGLQFLENDVNMIGQDGAYSVPLDDSSSLWLFGDTFVGTFDETGKRLVDRMPNNTGLICYDRDISKGIKNYTYITDEKGALRQLIPLSAEEEGENFHIWGMDACVIGKDIYWYYVLVKILADGTWPYKFDIAGSGLAKSDRSTLRFERIFHLSATHDTESPHVCYGVTALPVEEEGYLYVYGSYTKGYRHRCHVSRVRPDDIEDFSRYEFLSSPAPKWTADPKQAINIMEGMPTEMSVSFNRHLGAYLAVHSWETSGKIVGRTSDHPWGPWSDPVLLWTSRVPLRNPLVYDGPVVYAGKEHAEYARNNGKFIYVTYIEFEEYYPRLLEIEIV
jgi:hypothetical protein